MLQLRVVDRTSRRTCGADALDDWSYLEDDEIANSESFTRLFASEVTRLAADQNVSNNLSNEPRRTQPDDAARTTAESIVDLHVDAPRRTRRHPPGPGASDS